MTVVERAAAFKERALVAERRSTTNLLRLRSSAAALKLVKALSSGNKTLIRKTLDELCGDYGLNKSQLASGSVLSARKKGRL
jgi:hypothetical protein